MKDSFQYIQDAKFFCNEDKLTEARLIVRLIDLTEEQFGSSIVGDLPVNNLKNNRKLPCSPQKARLWELYAPFF